MSALRAVRVPVERMTAESFASYGEVFGAGEIGELPEMQQTPFEHDGRVTLASICQPQAGLSFTRLERHFAVTQAFVQLSGAPSVVCVAPPTDLADMAAVPEPGSVRGFLIDPGLGYLFRRGTWHSLERYLLAPPGATFLIVNVAPNPTQIVDYASGAMEMHDDLGTSAPRPLGKPGPRGVRFEIAR